MAETSSLLNCRTRKGTEGSNPSLSAAKFAGLFERISGCSAVRLAYLVWDQVVAGSNPATPTTKSLKLVSLKFDVLFIERNSTVKLQTFLFLVP